MDHCTAHLLSRLALTGRTAVITAVHERVPGPCGWRTGREKGGLAIHSRVMCLQEEAKAKFNESVEIAINLGVDPRRGDQQVRSAVVLPHGTGTDTRVAVFAEDEAAEAARAAGDRQPSPIMRIMTIPVFVHELFTVACTCLASLHGTGTDTRFAVSVMEEAAKRSRAAL